MLYFIFFINYSDGMKSFNSDHVYSSEGFPNRKQLNSDIVSHYLEKNKTVLQPQCIAITGIQRLTKEEFDSWTA